MDNNVLLGIGGGWVIYVIIPRKNEKILCGISWF